MPGAFDRRATPRGGMHRRPIRRRNCETQYLVWALNNTLIRPVWPRPPARRWTRVFKTFAACRPQYSWRVTFSVSSEWRRPQA